MAEETNDSSLIEGIRHRDNASFEYLYKKSYPYILNFVMKSGGSKDDVKDLLQDSLIIIYENITEGKFRGESGLLTYLTGICKNRWHSYLQRRKMKNIPMDNYSNLMNLVYEEHPEGELTERAKYAESLLSQSTDRCKEILMAYYYENLTMEAIAEKLGYTNADNAKSQKAKCMDKLRKAVKNLVINEL